jgi:peptidoglycan/xylan/chitin deacetylase (PgdA/CDA1 family)
MRRPCVSWPNDARIAVNFYLVLEAWAGPQAQAGIRVTPDFPREASEAGQRDWATESWQNYGGQAGFYRLMDVLNEYGVKGSASISALAVETWPDLVREFVASGHEPAGHAYSQETRLYRLSRDEERANIRRCMDAFTDILGERPVGWGSPGGQRSDHTPTLLLEEGFLWEQDFRDDDVPYIAAEQDGRRLVAMPNTFEINDAVLMGRYGNPPGAYVETFRYSFDRLYKEGERAPKLLTVLVHATHYGRPFGGHALEQCIQYAQQFPRVWIARRRDVAQWYLDHVGQ